MTIEKARSFQLHRQIQSRLPANSRQQRVRLLQRNNLLADIRRQRFDIGGVGKLRVCHDRRRVGVDEHDAIALRLQRLASLHAAVIEFASLTDNDGSRTNDHDALDVGTLGHQGNRLRFLLLQRHKR